MILNVFLISTLSTGCLSMRTESTQIPISLPQSVIQQKCIEAGGIWREFPNGCVDSCFYVRNKHNVVCTQALTFGCDCGPQKCWDRDTFSCEYN